MTHQPTPAERLLWIAHRLDPDATVHNMALALRLTGPVDAPRLERAFDSVCREGDALRTTYHPEGVDGVRIETADAPIRGLQRIDLRDGDVEAFIADRARQRFDLSTCPYDVTLAELGPDQWLLLVVKHHLITDGGSFGAFTRRLAEHYAAATDGTPLEPFRTLPVAALNDKSAAFARQLAATCDTLVAPTTWSGRSHTPGGPSVRRALSLEGPVWDGLIAGPYRSFSPHLSRQCALVTALVVWIAETTGRTTVAVGLPMANRATPAERNALGVRIENLPLVVRLDPDDTPQTVFKKVRDGSMDLLRHARPGMATPALQRVIHVDFNYVPIPFTPLEGTEQTVEWVHPGHSEPRMALRIQVHDFDGRGPRVLVDLPTRTFPDPTPVLQRLTALIDHVANAPDAPFQLPTPGGDWERARTLSGLDRLPTVAPFQLATRFREVAVRTPDAVAIQHAGTSVTYGALLDRADGITRALQAAGVQRGDRVGIAHTRGPGLVAGLLGIHGAGAAYVPVEPTFPVDRLAAVFADCGVAVAVTDTPDRIPAGVRPVASDADGPDVQRPTVAPGDLAYVLFTSGSTGRPKGVMITHANVAALVHWSEQLFGDALAGCLGSTSACFDVSVFEMFVPLCTGHRLILADDLLHAPTVPEADAITFVSAVPSAMRALLVQDARPFPSASTVLLAGEFADEALVEQLYAGGFADVFDIYGATEATVHSIGGRRERGAPATIGRALPGELLYILDDQLQPCAIGEVGEMHLGGRGIATGYWDRDELTAARFIDAPAGSGTDRLYKTGDLGAFREDGQAVYHGRIDEQLKVRGYRIEPGEVAARARELDTVRAVWVGGVEGPVGTALAAAVVGCSSRQLREHLAAVLPAYMVPTLVVELDALPLTPNQKIDVPLLRSGTLFDLEAREETATANPLAVLVHQLVSRVLGRAADLDASFLDAGGDSISALHVSAAAQKHGLDLPPVALLSGSSLRTVAAGVEEQTAFASQASVSGGFEPPPIWSLADGSRRFDQSVVVQLQPTAPDAVQQALDQLLAHHDALRIRDDGAIHPGPDSWPLEVRDTPLADRPLRDPSAQGPRVHATLTPTHQLVLVAHHHAVDAITWSVLVDDLESLLRGDALPPKTTAYPAWCEAMRELPSAAAFWTETLPLDPQGLPDAPPTTAGDRVVKTTHHDVPGRFRGKVRELLLTALGHALADWRGGTVLVDVEGHGRIDAGPAVVRTAGWFTSLFPVPLDRQTTPEALRDWFDALPLQGAGHGLAVQRGELSASTAEVVFQYFGGATDDRMTGPLQLHRDPAQPVRHRLDVVVTHQADTVRVDWHHDPRVPGLRRLFRRFDKALDTLTSPTDFGLGDKTLGALAGLLGSR